MTSFTDRQIKEFIAAYEKDTTDTFAIRARRLAKRHRRMRQAYLATPAWDAQKRKRKGDASGNLGRDALIFSAVAETLAAHAPGTRLKDVSFKEVREAFSAAEGSIRGAAA